MRSHARVVVIGGGVVGCSVLYHLTKLGWRDVVLLERDELTSGSTWHAAGGMHTLNSDPNVAKLQDYTIRLYREIEAISGQSCGIHLTGGIMLAGTPERLDFLKTAHARGRLSRPRERVHLDRGGQAPPSADRDPGISWARCSTRTRAMSTPRASPMPTPRRPRSAAPRSIASRR